MNPFEVLGLTSRATKEEVVAAWRKLAMKHHPDRGGSHDEFVRLKKAYEEALKLVGPVINDIFGTARRDYWNDYKNRQTASTPEARARKEQQAREASVTQDLKTAWEQARENRYAQQPTCTACQGLGKIKVNHRAFGDFWMACPACFINQRKKK